MELTWLVGDDGEDSGDPTKSFGLGAVKPSRETVYGVIVSVEELCRMDDGGEKRVLVGF